MSVRIYLGVKPCGCVTAGLVDDHHTTAKEIAEFAAEMVKTGRRIENVPIDDGRNRLRRCTHTAEKP